MATKDLAVASFSEATTAIEKSEAQRDQAAEARGLRPQRHRSRGSGRRIFPGATSQLRTILIEEEKVRTLSSSTAQITFRDASRLRLNANSNAIIKVMRFDPLIEHRGGEGQPGRGRFLCAACRRRQPRSKFNVEIPDVDASIDSGNFWVSNDDEGAKFANYDDAVGQGRRQAARR